MCALRFGLSLLFFTLTLNADVTLRSSFEVKTNPAIPPELAESMKKQMQGLGEVAPSMFLKGNRAVMNQGISQVLSDFDGALVTLINTRQKVYATLEKNDYESAVMKSIALSKPLSPGESQALSGLTLESEMRVTGNTRTILDIPSEEREIRLKMELPPGAPGAMYMVYSLWSPLPDQFQKNKALQELEAYTQRAYEGTNPTAAIEKIFAQSPGFGEKMGEIAKQLGSVKAVLEMHISLQAPALFDTKTPLVEFVYSVKELSTAPIAESVFSIPHNYTVIPMDEALKGFLPPPDINVASPRPSK